MDEKHSRSSLAEAPNVDRVKKPLRKSLPRLPSEDANLSYEKKKATSRKVISSKETSESVNNLSEETRKAVSHTQGEEEDTAEGPILEPQENAALIEEAIAV